METELGDFFQNDVVLACQWADLRRSDLQTPEQRLHLAILRDALLCVVRPTGKPSTRQSRRIDALQWLRGAEDCYVSFDHVCQALNLDTAGFQQRLLTAIARRALNADAPNLTHMKMARL